MQELKEFLEEKVNLYNNPSFIETDPIQIPHRFTYKEDIEITAFLTATIAWGNRNSIIKSSEKMIDLMGENPFDFIINHKKNHLAKLHSFVHRTFNGIDFITFIIALQNIYLNHGGLEEAFIPKDKNDLQTQIGEFKKLFFSIDHHKRTQKHISNPLENSAAKRINMFLRWMVRKDNKGVDFGIWNKISPAQLSCPLDVHSGNVARKLLLLNRMQNDAKAVKELDLALRLFDKSDPVKYDFALFGLGAFEKF